MNKMSFKQLHNWKDTLKFYNNKALQQYTNLKHTILDDSLLSQKDKHLILMGVNAARRYESGIMHHTKQAYDLGATVYEIVEILTSCILSRGIPAWLEGIKAIELVLENEALSKKITISDKGKINNLEEAIEYFKKDNNDVIPKWVMLMEKYSAESLIHYASLRKNELRNSAVSRKLKELVLIAINLAERYEFGVKLHITGAKKEGATDEEIAEVALLCVLASGIPAWLEVSQFLHG